MIDVTLPNSAYLEFRTWIETYLYDQSPYSSQAEILFQKIHQLRLPLKCSWLISLITDDAVDESWIECFLQQSSWPKNLCDEYLNPVFNLLITSQRSVELGMLWFAVSQSSPEQSDSQGFRALDLAVLHSNEPWWRWLTQTLCISPLKTGDHDLNAFDFASGIRWPQCLRDPQYHLGHASYSTIKQEQARMLEESVHYLTPGDPHQYRLYLNTWKTLRRFHRSWQSLSQEGLSTWNDPQSRNALHWASHASQEHHALAWLDFHLEFHCDLIFDQHPDVYGLTPLDYALRMEYFTLAQRLQNAQQCSSWGQLLSQSCHSEVLPSNPRRL